MRNSVIISCPSCQKQYNLSDDLIKKEQHKVRCIDCKHVWVYVKKITNLESVDNENTLKKTNQNIKKDLADKTIVQRYRLDWILLTISLVLLLLFGYREHEYLFKKMPPKSWFFHREGLISVKPNQALLIQQVDYSIKKRDLKPQVIVTGEVYNPTKEILNLPGLLISVSPSEAETQKNPTPTSWHHNFPIDKILPGERVAFEAVSAQDNIQAIEKIDIQIG